MGSGLIKMLRKVLGSNPVSDAVTGVSVGLRDQASEKRFHQGLKGSFRVKINRSSEENVAVN